jgi:hypothetical protein
MDIPLGWRTRAMHSASTHPFAVAARRVVTSATALTLASGAHKAAMFALRARIGQVGGASALGALTSVLTATWMISAFSHLGLPDRAMVRGAVAADEDAQHTQARHGLFLGTAALALVGALALTLPGAADPWLAALLVTGALAQHASTLTTQTLRGRGRPALEATALTLAALGLGLGAWRARDPREVAVAYAGQGAVFVGVFLVGLAVVPALRPRWPRPRAALAETRESLPIFVVGVTGFALGSADLMVGALVLDDAAVGALTCATMVVRTSFQVPWIVGTLALRWVRDAGPARMRVVGLLAGTAAILGALAGLSAWLTRGLAAQLFGVPLARFEDALAASAWLAPVISVGCVVLPQAMALALRGSLRATLAAAAVTALATFSLAAPLGLVGVQLGYALGHATLGAGLLFALWRSTPREQAP